MAEDARAIAARLRDPEARGAMLRIAEGYDDLAERAAEMSHRSGGRRSDDPSLPIRMGRAPRSP